jgi:hypothetical protein
MIVSVGHALSVEEARNRIDRDLERILRSPLPAGLKLGEVEREWEGDTLTASTRASAGVISLNIGGALTVSPTAVALDFDIPAMALAFVNEKDIEAALRQELGTILAG